MVFVFGKVTGFIQLNRVAINFSFLMKLKVVSKTENRWHEKRVEIKKD